MEDEIFNISIIYEGNTISAEVHTSMPVGPLPLNANYRIILPGHQDFVLNPSLNECDNPCWKLKSGNTDLKLVVAVGDAIEEHYL